MTIRIHTKLTKKRKAFLAGILGKSHILWGMDSYYAEGDEEGFMDCYHISFSEAEKALQALREFLQK